MTKRRTYRDELDALRVGNAFVTIAVGASRLNGIIVEVGEDCLWISAMGTREHATLVHTDGIEWIKPE